jgi:hypothetical protein
MRHREKPSIAPLKLLRAAQHIPGAAPNHQNR